MQSALNSKATFIYSKNINDVELATLIRNHRIQLAKDETTVTWGLQQRRVEEKR